ncbi:unnamed protein product [Rotaria sp. Silwood1]|nr:unnamed protein product [Rotaria sp. Silwood1]
MVSHSTQSSRRSIRLNVYYLTPYRSLHTIFNLVTLGLFTPYHSAIEIEGYEYAYYGHPFQFSGIMSGAPNKVAMMLAYSKIYGHTLLSNMGIEAKLHELAFMGVDYKLLHFNCNTFADAFLYALTKHHLPRWITRPERCLRRINCMHRFFNGNDDIGDRIVSALYIKSAGDQAAVFKLLGIVNDQRLTTFYEVMLQDYICRGKIPDFERLHQLSDLQIKDHLSHIHNNFFSTFPTKNSITLNKIFDNLASLQRQLITLFQVPQYEHLQILICNGNSLTTLAGVEYIKHLWKLDVGNNQIRSLQHLSRFIALGSLILSNNNITWIELQHIRHMFILDLRLDGNPSLDADPNYRQHVLDCLPRIWMCDGIFVSTAERNQVDEFFTQSSLTQKPVRRKLARDIFMPTNLKDRSINGLFGAKATELFARFPMNCFVNSELDRKRIKHLAYTIQDLLLTEMKYDDEKRHDEFLTENRHMLLQMIDLRQTHIEEFNMFLILLITDILFQLPGELLHNVLDVTHIKIIGNLNIPNIFSSSEQLKCMIASLVHAGARLDRDENHPSAFYDKLFNSLSVVLTHQVRQLSSSNTQSVHPNPGLISEAKSMVCLEVMQVLIMCPSFYTLIDNTSVNAILKQALYRSPAYGSIKDVLESFNTDQKTGEEQKELLSSIIGNILKMAIRTLSTKRIKKINEPLPAVYDTTTPEIENSNRRLQEQTISSPKSSQRTNVNRVPAIGDRILTAPQSFGRIVTLPDAEIAMIQLDHVLAHNGAMISSGSANEHTTYVNMNNFEWDPSHEYWKPKFASGDKITLQMTTIRSETPRLVSPLSTPPPPRTIASKTPEPIEKGRVTPKLFDMNLNKSKEAFVDAPRETIPSPLVPIIHQETIRHSQEVSKCSPRAPSNNQETIHHSQEISNSSPPSSPITERKVVIPEEMPMERPMSVRIIKQKQEQVKTSVNGETVSTSPVLIESMLLLMPNQPHVPIVSFEQTQRQANSLTINGYEPSRNMSMLNHSSTVPLTPTNGRRSATHRAHVPVHNASQWFNGPDMQNERTGRMEKVVASLVRRSFRPFATYAMPRAPTLTSPSSRDHAQYKVRPESFQDFCIESHRMTTTPLSFVRQSQSPKGRYTSSIRFHDFSRTSNSNHNVHRAKSLINPPCPTPWM